MHHPASILVAAYGEIALKGRNRPMFQRRLANNMRTAVAGESVSAIKHVESRFLIHLDDPSRADAVITKLQRVFGLQWIAPAVAVLREEPMRDLERVSEIAVEMALRDVGNARTFKVDTKRSDRGFPLQSMEINRIVGHAVGAAIQLPARMSGPDFTVHVILLRKNILVATARIPAPGGLPAGISGRVACLLSGGIDSPVAAWLMMKRGCRPTLVHVHQGRNAEEADAGKIIALARVLGRYSPTPLTLYLVPVVPYELRAMDAVDDRHDMVMFRRYIVKVAAVLALRERCLGLVIGDSVGQVASQTLHNLAAIAPDVSLPVYRPLIGFDKLEITALAETIGSFALSIAPYRDCCSIRSPRPVLNARPETLLALSRVMDLDAAVQEAVAASTRMVVGADVQ